MTELSSYKNGSSCSSSYNFLAKFQKSCRRKEYIFKDYAECEYKLARTATSATNLLETLDIPHFSAVAVPKNSATSTATSATKNQDMKGGKQHEAN